MRMKSFPRPWYLAKSTVLVEALVGDAVDDWRAVLLHNRECLDIGEVHARDWHSKRLPASNDKACVMVVAVEVKLAARRRELAGENQNERPRNT